MVQAVPGDEVMLTIKQATDTLLPPPEARMDQGGDAAAWS